MSEPQIIHTLKAKQVELQDAIDYLEGKLAEARSDLGHVNAVLRLYEVDGTRLQFPAHVNLSRMFKRGDLVRLAKLALEAEGRPLTTRDLAEAVIAAKGWDTADKVLREGVTYRLVQALTIAWKRKGIDSPGKSGNVRLWALREA